MTFRQVYKITVFVPSAAIKQLVLGILKVTSLAYGPYEHVLWRSSPGVEQFRPLAGAKPAVGDIEKLTEQPSIELIFTVPRDENLLREVLDALLQAHPWEQPVILAEEAIATAQVHSAQAE